MQKSALVAMLRNDRAEFQRVRDLDPRAEMDLSGADLSGCDLAGAPLAGVTLRGACLRGADCTNANFRFADLSGADLRDAELEGANLHQTVLEGANLEGVTLGGVDRETRVCLHATSFRSVRWSREEIETMIGILNENESWEIRYELVPRGQVESAGSGEA